VRSRLIGPVAAAAALLLAACSGAHAGEGRAAVPSAAPSVPPAAAAGGACILWDYGFIESKIGVRFTVAAADVEDETSTCVVQSDGADLPDLALSVVESTPADARTFATELEPKGAVKVPRLGRFGYRKVTPATAGRGPVVEVCWLSDAAQIQTLRFTFPPGAPADQVDQMGVRLILLAKALNTSRG
jgi:hypothetical protein